jgi:hypothetical protein
MFTIELRVIIDEFEAHRPTIQKSLFPVEFEVVKSLYSFCPEAYRNINAPEWSSSKAWTKAIKEQLYELGQRKGYLVFPEKSADGFEGEWLLDLVWADAKADAQGKLDWKMTRRLALGCESEWSTYAEDILADFYKLTFVIADLRLFIYHNRPTTGTREDPAELCKAACPLSTGFRYLLVGFPEDASGKRGFRIDAWTA